ncbi:hypothetical protein PVAP13_1KG068400 [Panicum virgatum]|uniref:Uncharacterized protein n=1 Tax=Panicum virgatum TaxID=38727 RepID=A0A8T0X7Z1_PANVG|nr:hypothetical protein PVAP13_1KG068400 [Panicum virgatum]
MGSDWSEGRTGRGLQNKKEHFFAGAGRTGPLLYPIENGPLLRL